VLGFFKNTRVFLNPGLQVILGHSGIDYLMISRVKLIPVVLGGIAMLEILETK